MGNKRGYEEVRRKKRMLYSLGSILITFFVIFAIRTVPWADSRIDQAGREEDGISVLEPEADGNKDETEIDLSEEQIEDQEGEADEPQETSEESSSVQASPDLGKNVFLDSIGEADVDNWSDFIAAVSNAAIDTINITGSFGREVTTANNNPGTISRSITINGNNNTINFGNGSAAGLNGIILGNVSQDTYLIVNDLNIEKPNHTLVAVFSTAAYANTTVAGGDYWHAHFRNVDVTNSGLIFAANGNVTMSGECNLVKSNAAQHGNSIRTKNLTVAEGAKINISVNENNSSASADAAVAITNNGEVRLEKDAEVRITNMGIWNGTDSNDTAANIFNTYYRSAGIYGNVSLLFLDEGAFLDIDTKHTAYRTAVTSELIMKKGAVFNAHSSLKTGIGMNSHYDYTNRSTIHGTIHIEGEGTQLNASTENTISGYYMAGAAVYVEGEGSQITVTDGAEFNVKADSGVTGSSANNTCLNIKGNGAELMVANGGNLNIESGAANGYQYSTLRFVFTGNMKFTVDNATATIKTAANTAASSNSIRMYGGNNIVDVRNGGHLYIHNQGSGSSTAGGDNGNGGIHYQTGSEAQPNSFIVEGEESSVEIIAEWGPAIYSSGGTIIQAGEGTSFYASGRPTTASATFYSTASLKVEINQPKFFDFTNSRAGGGNIFRCTNSNNYPSTLTATKTNLAVWENTAYLEGNPNKSWSMFDFVLNGANLANVSSSSIGAEFNNYGNTTSYTRMSANNAAPIIDKMRIPTNADKYIFGHASIPEGHSQESRDAWTGEVYVLVNVYDEGELLYEGLKGVTIGAEAEGGGLQVYFDEADGGLFKIAVPDGEFLKEGYTVEAVAAWRGFDADTLEEAIENERNIFCEPDNLLSNKVTTQHVIPPMALTRENIDDGVLTLVKDDDENEFLSLTTRTKIISGTASPEQEGMTVYCYLNDELMRDQQQEVIKSTITDGKWSLDLQNIDGNLQDEDKISIAVNDNIPNTEELEESDLDVLSARGFGFKNGGTENPWLRGDNTGIEVEEKTENGTEETYYQMKFHDTYFRERLELEVVYYGTLELIAPDKISFGRQSISPFKQQYRVMEMYQNNQKIEKFGVQDTRVVKDTWHLYVKMDQEMTHTGDTNLRLLNALAYVRNGTEHILNKDVEELAVQELNPDDELYDVYGNKWYDATEQKDGLYLNVRPGAAKAGSYTGSLTWILKDVP